jgi:hypothetical protein
MESVETKAANGAESVLPPTAPVAPPRRAPAPGNGHGRSQGSGLLLIKAPEHDEQPLISSEELAMLLEPLPASPLPRIFKGDEQGGDG